MKLILAGLLFSTLAFSSENTEMMKLWGCTDVIACTAVTGPYSFATAMSDDAMYEQKGNNNTCCQLSQGLVIKICEAGHESNGLEAFCRE